MNWITTSELETSLSPTVPALVTAFHHATNGKYLKAVDANMREWADDRVSGAATLAKQALQIVRGGGSPTTMKMLRPRMVAITNVLQRLDAEQEKSSIFHYIQLSLDREAGRAVQLAVTRINVN